MGKNVTALMVTYNPKNFKDFAKAYARQILGCSDCVRTVGTFDDLVRTLREYDQIGTLVIFTHSGEGSLLLNGADGGIEIQSLDQVASRFGSQAPTVSTELIFEGCMVGRAPDQLVKVASTFKAPKATAFTYFHVEATRKVVVHAGDKASDLQSQSQVAKYAGYFLPNTPFDKMAVPANVGKTLPVIVEWFRDMLIKDDLPVGDGQRSKKYRRRADAEPLTITAAQTADKAAAWASQPVLPLIRVTVTP